MLNLNWEGALWRSISGGKHIRVVQYRYMLLFVFLHSIDLLGRVETLVSAVVAGMSLSPFNGVRGTCW